MILYTLPNNYMSKRKNFGLGTAGISSRSDLVSNFIFEMIAVLFFTKTIVETSLKDWILLADFLRSLQNDDISAGGSSDTAVIGGSGRAVPSSNQRPIAL